MASVLRAFLKRIIQKGTLEVEAADGERFRIGDGTGSLVAIRFSDRAAERQLLLNPALAFGELFTDSRIVVT